MKKILLASVLSLLATVSSAETIGEKLQGLSVTIKTTFSQGSGVIVTRKIDGKNVNFVWTAAHVIDDLRRTRRIIDSSGASRTVVYFKRASIVKEIVEDGQRVGELKMDAKVVRYSNYNTGEDLALLRILKKDFIKGNVEFHLEDSIPNVTTKLCHVGSLLGQFGANSFTSGRMSQIGRVLSNEKVFDQTTVTAFPGSSGGGVFFEEGPNSGKYIGMLVRGAGETFNLIVPIRRMRAWAKRTGVLFAIDPRVKAPTEAQLKLIPVEDSGVISATKRRVQLRSIDGTKFMIRPIEGKAEKKPMPLDQVREWKALK